MVKYHYILLFFITSRLFGQIDSIQNIDEINILSRITLSKHNLLERNEINIIQPTDIGDLLRKFPGTYLRSYGGLGGLKTVSMRGLGSNHSSIVVDGFQLHNSQTGQINLGQLIVDNVQSVNSTVGLNSNFLLPISTQIAGNNFIINTMENSFSIDTLTIRSNINYGSFEQYKGYLGVKYNPNKFFISSFFSKQNSVGNYRYSIVNGINQNSRIRKNNKYSDFNFGISSGLKIFNGTWKIGYQHKSIDQELPGAVILYNETADETLQTVSDRLFTDFKYEIGKLFIRSFINGSIENQRYYDPTYLNNIGFIDYHYKNRSLNSGISFINYFDDWFLYGGLDYTFSDLLVNDITFAKPIRNFSSSMFGVKFNNHFFSFTTQLSGQYINELNQNGVAANNIFRVNPFISLKTRKISKKSQLDLWYRNSFRMPSFNELYYNNIGNVDLLPENANQTNLDFLFVDEMKNISFDFKTAIYFNQIKNKILAIPTKNLFIWSFQNIGRVNVFGGEIQINTNYYFSNNFNITLMSNYTYQKSIDVTNSDSPTYLNQIAYTPEHMFNFDLTLNYKENGLRISNYFISKRYSLNENIISNYLNPIFLMDLSVFKKLNIRKSQNLRFIFNVKNILNTSYAYIRSYTMPGINFSINISYAFN